MALEMDLEMNGDVAGWHVLKSILQNVGLSHLEERGEYWMRGVLGQGELAVGASWGKPPRDGVIRAEGAHGCEFDVNGNLTFRINNSMYDEAVATIKNVLTQLTQKTDMQFVLSFQLEDVRAIRDHERGFDWFWNDPR